MMTFIPNELDATSDAMNGKSETLVTETPTIIEFGGEMKERTPLLDRLPQRWGLIAGLVGVSVALATTATVVANVVARHHAEPIRVIGFRPVRRYGARHVTMPRGGSAWVAYLYRTPDLRMRLPIHK
jgi:hypothetical protein